MREQIIFKMMTKNWQTVNRRSLMSAGKLFQREKNCPIHWKRPCINSRATNWLQEKMVGWWRSDDRLGTSDSRVVRGILERRRQELGDRPCRTANLNWIAYVLRCVTNAVTSELGRHDDGRIAWVRRSDVPKAKQLALTVSVWPSTRADQSAHC